MRDKLVELLKKADEYASGVCTDYDEAQEVCADYLIYEGVVALPFAIGETVYHITTCEGFNHELDGNLYDSFGGLGDATGYYCPCELRNNCPFDNEEDFDCDTLKTKEAVFEDTVKGFFVEEYGTWVYLEYSGNVSLSDFGKTVFLTREEAEKALAEMIKEYKR